MTAKTIVGRLAPNAWRSGNPLPEVGSLCLVSGANCDVDSDQHRSYMWRKVVGYGDSDMFVCLQTEGCWPTVERTENCWFAEITVVRNDAQQQAEPSGDIVKKAGDMVMAWARKRKPMIDGGTLAWLIEFALFIMEATSQGAGVAEGDTFIGWVFNHRDGDDVWVVRSPSGSQFVAQPGMPVHELIVALTAKSAHYQDSQQEADICPNCDTAMPGGCGGLFRGDGHSCRLNHTQPQAEGRQQ